LTGFAALADNVARMTERAGQPNYGVLLSRFISSRQWDRVLETAREWLARDPENIRAHHAAAQGLINLKKHSEAEPHLARVLARSPENGTAHRWMSIIQFHQQKFKAADESIHRALSVNPEDTYNWYHLAWMLYKQGDLESARKYASKALELAPQNADTINLLALCTPRNQSATDVLRRYREALAVDPEKPVVHNNIGVYHLNVEKDYAAAEECFRRALFFDPSLKIARTNLFNMLKRRDPVYRAMCAPKDFILKCFNAVRRRRGNFVLYILAIPVWILAFRFLIAGLVLWFLFVWPMMQVYQYLTIGDIRAQAGELGARRGGFLGYRRWPLRLRLSLFGLVLVSAWGGVIYFIMRGGPAALGDTAQVLFGLIILIGLLILLGFWIRARWKSSRNRSAARHRARRFSHLLESRREK
jgi:Flp pilus assembly protein TadD